MKKLISTICAATFAVTALTACGNSGNLISVVSREDGSGTRGAFVELIGVTDASGNDATCQSAEITNSTSVMLTTVAGNESSIGYVSLGSLSTDVTAVTIDGAEATVDNIKSGAYSVARPFNIVYKGGSLNKASQDFVDFIFSKDGQSIIEKQGYISIGSDKAYSASGISCKVSLSGSTSVAPVMEKLADAYKGLNPSVTIEIEQTGSSAGITSASDGVCDIGMSSRDLKAEEAQKLSSTQIAMDGIAVIVNNKSSVKNLTKSQIKDIFTGTTTSWADVK